MWPFSAGCSSTSYGMDSAPILSLSQDDPGEKDDDKDDPGDKQQTPCKQQTAPSRQACAVCDLWVLVALAPVMGWIVHWSSVWQRMTQETRQTPCNLLLIFIQFLFKFVCSNLCDLWVQVAATVMRWMDSAPILSLSQGWPIRQGKHLANSNQLLVFKPSVQCDLLAFQC